MMYPVIISAEEYNKLISIKRKRERLDTKHKKATQHIQKLKEELEEKQVMLDTQKKIIDKLKEENLDLEYQQLQREKIEKWNKEQRELERKILFGEESKPKPQAGKEKAQAETDHLEADVFRYVFTNEKAELFEAPSRNVLV